MASTFGRIGKSLIKFLKPIRTVLPHDPNKKHQGSTFELTQFKKDLPSTVLSEEKSQQSNPGRGSESDLVETAESRLEKAPTQWLELVVFLLSKCKRVSEKVKKRNAVATYNATVASRGRQSIKSLGSIVNTLSDDIETVTEKNEQKLKKVA